MLSVEEDGLYFFVVVDGFVMVDFGLFVVVVGEEGGGGEGVGGLIGGVYCGRGLG